MKLSRLDLDGAGSPSALVAKIFEVEPDLPVPIPIEHLCSTLDIISITELQTEGFEAALVTDRLKANGAILLAKDRSPQRQRFSIAHELGHFLIPMHAPPISGGFQCRPGDMRTMDIREQDRRQRMEAEANRFAALLLMPTHLLRADLRQARTPDLQHVARLARRYVVSQEAMARAYVDHHREPLAVVMVRNHEILRCYIRKGAFPWLDALPGSAIPSASLYHEQRLDVGIASPIEPCDPMIWFDSSSACRVDQLTEQVLPQRDGSAFILLHAHLHDNEDDRDTEARQREIWQPRF